MQDNKQCQWNVITQVLPAYSPISLVAEELHDTADRTATNSKFHYVYKGRIANGSRQLE